jgi:hypothetical protein
MTKDELESIYLNGFAKAIQDFPVGRLVKSENPDFLVHSAPGTIGVELTRVFRKPAEDESPLREQESLRERVAELAKVRYSESGRPPVHVSIFFNDQVALRRQDVELLAGQLVSLTMRLMPNSGERREEEYNWINRDYFPEPLSLVRVHRAEQLRKSIWSTPSAEYLTQLSFSDIQSLIATKDARVPDYLKQCDRVWLVLCTCGEGLSSYVEFAEDAVQGVYQARFERVFAYKWSSAVRELAVRANP